MQPKKVFVDTNILLNPKFNINGYEIVHISIISLEELDGLKKDEKIGYLARQAIRNVNYHHL